MEPTPKDKAALVQMLEELYEKDSNMVKPFLGKDARFMVVYDYATPSEAKAGTLTESKAFSNTNLALWKAHLSKSDAYWTALVKRQKDKKEKVFSNTVLEESFKILLEEIAILRPTVIVCLGTQVAKMFDGSLKGGASDNAGKVLYRADLDCNVMFSINPSMLFFNPDLEPLLTETFETVESML
jgi:DNA polymerase-3 subunit alpha